MGSVADRIKRNAEKQRAIKSSKKDDKIPDGGFKSEKTKFGKPLAVPKLFKAKPKKIRVNLFLSALVVGALLGPISFCTTRNISSEMIIPEKVEVYKFERTAKDQAVLFFEGNYSELIGVKTISGLDSLIGDIYSEVVFPKISTISLVSQVLNEDTLEETYIYNIKSTNNDYYDIHVRIAPPDEENPAVSLIEYPAIFPSENRIISATRYSSVNEIVFERVVEWVDVWAQNDKTELFVLSGDSDSANSYLGSKKASRLLQSPYYDIENPRVNATWKDQSSGILFVSFIHITCGENPEILSSSFDLLIENLDTQNPLIVDWEENGGELEKYSNSIPVNENIFNENIDCEPIIPIPTETN